MHRVMSIRWFVTLILGLSLYYNAAAQSPRLGAGIRAYFELYPELDAESKDLILEVLDKGVSLDFPLKVYESLQLLYVSDSTLSIRTSPVSTLTLQVLQSYEGKPLLMTIESVEKPLVDSRLSFWTSEWEALDGAKFFTPPSALDFVRSRSEDAYLVELLRPLYCHYTLSTQGLLELKLSTPILLNDTTREQATKAIAALPPLRYQWNGKQWLRL